MGLSPSLPNLPPNKSCAMCATASGRVCGLGWALGTRARRRKELCEGQWTRLGLRSPYLFSYPCSLSLLSLSPSLPLFLARSLEYVCAQFVSCSVGLASLIFGSHERRTGRSTFAFGSHARSTGRSAFIFGSRECRTGRSSLGAARVAWGVLRSSLGATNVERVRSTFIFGSHERRTGRSPCIYLHHERRTERSTFVFGSHERRTGRSTFIWGRCERRTVRSTFIFGSHERRTGRSTFILGRPERRTGRSTFISPHHARRTGRSTFSYPHHELRPGRSTFILCANVEWGVLRSSWGATNIEQGVLPPFGGTGRSQSRSSSCKHCW